MAQAKILNDRIVITSDVLTDSNIEKVKVLAPSVLKLVDELDLDAKVLYEVDANDYNTFTINGALFKGGKTTGSISEETLALDEEVRKAKINTALTAVLTKLNVIEEKVTEFLENAEDFSDDIEFLD